MRCWAGEDVVLRNGASGAPGLVLWLQERNPPGTFMAPSQTPTLTLVLTLVRSSFVFSVTLFCYNLFSLG